MDPIASEDTNNAPAAVSDDLIHAENEAVEQQQAQGIQSFDIPLCIPLCACLM